MSFGMKGSRPPVIQTRKQARRYEEPVGTADLSKRLAAWMISGGTLRTGPLGVTSRPTLGGARLYGG